MDQKFKNNKGDRAGCHGPKVTVAIAIHNGAGYLAEAMESVLSQTFTDFEIIAVDDGSSDNTLAILRRFASEDGRVRVITRENRGLVASLNETLSHAAGEYYARMDADDICVPERFEKQVAYLNENSAVVAVGAQVLLVDPVRRPMMKMPVPLQHDEIDACHLSGSKHALTHPVVMMRLDVIRAVGGYSDDYRHAEDHDLWLRLAEVGELANLPDVLLHYRQHGASVGYTKRMEQRRAQWLAARDAAARRGLPFELSEPKPMTATSDRVYERWAWWALQGENVKTARHYAVQSLLRRPFSTQAWLLAACAVRGY